VSATAAVIKQIVAKLRGEPALADELADTADLVGEIALDSLEMLQFMLEVEERLAIRIDFERLEFAHLRSIRTLAEFLDAMPARARVARTS
jgi:acyl carrier protein